MPIEQKEFLPEVEARRKQIIASIEPLWAEETSPPLFLYGMIEATLIVAHEIGLSPKTVAEVIANSGFEIARTPDAEA